MALFALWDSLVAYKAACVQSCWINEPQLLNLGRSADMPIFSVVEAIGRQRDRWMTLAFVLAIGALTAFAFATRFYPGRILYCLPVLAVAAAWVFRAAEISKLQKGAALLLLVFVIGQTSHRIFSRPTSFPRCAHAQWLDVVNAAGIEPHHRVYTDDWAPLVVSEGNFIPVRAEFSIRSPEALGKLPTCEFVTVDPTRGLEEFLTNLGFSPFPSSP